ncbi:protein kinase [Klebsiella pneumoniae]|nr:protein kinase [Klebsiella pneumoniae]
MRTFPRNALPECPLEGFRTVEILGSGGNGDVTKIANNDTGEEFALKILRRIQDDTYQRFKNEVKIVTECGIEGVMPITSSYLPEDPRGSKPWYVMPLAKPFITFIEGKSFSQIINAFIPLAETLERLHMMRIFHRDIKPDNFLIYNDRIYITDFGLVKFPDSGNLTPEKRDVGAKFTMAPEMRRIAFKADGEPADVYSFAKSLWIALTKQILGFDGQYIKGSTLSLANYEKDVYLAPLDELLHRATDNDPARRPPIKVFKEELMKWLKLNEDFSSRNLTEWLEIQNLLFPMGSPAHAEWRKKEDIINILSVIAERKSLNHMFYPTGGGMDLKGVEPSGESGFISLLVGFQSAEILKPQKLCYESFGFDPEWNYFWLEAEKIEPISGVALSNNGFDQYLTELDRGAYTGPEAWEYNEYNCKPLPETARRINRYIKGAFVFFSKASRYNRTSSTYDAWQNIGEVKFRELIEKAAARYRR